MGSYSLMRLINSSLAAIIRYGIIQLIFSWRAIDSNFSLVYHTCSSSLQFLTSLSSISSCVSISTALWITLQLFYGEFLQYIDFVIIYGNSTFCQSLTIRTVVFNTISCVKGYGRIIWRRTAWFAASHRRYVPCHAIPCHTTHST